MPVTSPMNRRERILAAINHLPVDRIPTDLWCTAEVAARLRAHFGPGVDIAAALHIDGFAGAWPTYIGPAPAVADADPVWGLRYHSANYATGTYREQLGAPLASATTIDDLRKFRWPLAEWFDYSQLQPALARVHDHQAVQVGYMAPFYYHNQLRGLEQSFMDPLEEPEFTHYLLQRLSDFFYDQHRRMFEAADGLIDVAQVTDDLGGQHAPLMSMEVFRTFYKPHLKRFIDLCKEFNIKVFHHDDGAMSTFIPDLLELGIDVLNPIQWTCTGMDPVTLKRSYGKRLCFHGAVENQQILPFGTPAEVRTEVRHCIDTLASDGTGYILCSCHNLQPNTPTANIIAMYDEAWRYGRRS